MTRRRMLFALLLVTPSTSLLARTTSSSLAFVALFTVSLALAITAPVFGKGVGFPLSRAFARPIQTWVLVGAPLAYVFVAAAACWLLPAAVARLASGAAFPLVSVAITMGAVAVLVACAVWLTRSAVYRTALALGACVVAGLIFRLLDPFRNASRFYERRDLSPDVFVLSGPGVLGLAIIVLITSIVIVRGVEWQRHNIEQAGHSSTTGASSRKAGGDIVEWFRTACSRALRWQCPVSSAAAAEVWFELQSYGIPVLAIGVVLSGCIPLLVHWGTATKSAIPIVLAGCSFAGPFVAGVSAAIWNRRNAYRSQISAFEAARPMDTASLIGLQVLIASLCVAGAWLLMWISFSLSYQTDSRFNLTLILDGIVSFVFLATLLALLAALRALAGWRGGWRVWIWSTVLVLYALSVAAALSRDWVGEAVIGLHLWFLAIAVPMGTLVILTKALGDLAISRRQLTTAALVWVPFAALYIWRVRSGGAGDETAALAALTYTAALLPLTAFGLAPWTLDRVRHG